MYDFLNIVTEFTKKGIELRPTFKIKKSKDLMIKGGQFYAIWDEEEKLWKTDWFDSVTLIDNQLRKYVEENNQHGRDNMKYLSDSHSHVIADWKTYCEKYMGDNFHPLNTKIIFRNTDVKKEDYSSIRLDYDLEEGSIEGWDKLISTLYEPEERHKIEWAIGSIVAGKSKDIQKFIVLYGSAGTGKSTILDIIQKMFPGHYAMFDAKALGSKSDAFALEPFKNNPLIGIQHDGDLSRIEDNTRLNSLVSHETMSVNEKFKSMYSTKFNAFLFMGTNTPVRITDAKSGLLRRLIDVKPSGNKLSYTEYNRMKNMINFELGAIAYHCMQVYNSDPNYYDTYKPVDMLETTNIFYNFVEENYYVFKKEEPVTLKMAWALYKEYIDDAGIQYPMNKKDLKQELKNYFEKYVKDTRLDDGSRVVNAYFGFKDIFKKEEPTKGNVSPEEADAYSIDFKEQPSILDEALAEMPAQYATAKGSPVCAWAKNKTILKDIDTSKLHYTKVPKNHIVIDFDIPGENGEKDFKKNLEAANKFPKTYAELSKSGSGIHLHYLYSGDVDQLSRIYDEHIEVKVYTGDASLRRKLTKCNDLPIATINSGLPLRGEKKMLDKNIILNEKAIRTTLKRCMNKEYHAGTKPSIDFIEKILTDAYNSGIKYDVSDMQTAIMAFAMQSTHQAEYCIKVVNRLKFKSEETSDSIDEDKGTIIFYDVEVFPNLFLVNWKYDGKGKQCVRMINPEPAAIEALVKRKLVGFNCRNYDNHILYARMMGYTNIQLFNLSQRIISGDKSAMFGEAYNISYTDVYDYAAKKQSLKKWEIELGIHHKELGLPWDQPVPEDKWIQVAKYCDNDVFATEAVFHHTAGDFAARKILADLAGGSVNDTTNQLTTRIIFGRERKPKLVYTDLATGERTDGICDKNIINAFPGYEFKFVEGSAGKQNIFRGTNLGFGGYVYAEPGMYGNVALLDVKSMHPSSIINMNCFGEYTQRFKDIKDGRLCVKEGRVDDAAKLLDGKLVPYLQNPEIFPDLAQALKIAINSVYGLTSARFTNPFRDSRNENNIVALRGALFMRTLQDEVQKRGFTVAHIKTDSIKIPDATPEIIEFVMKFGEQYGYDFDHEATYDRMCLVNDAVYIAKYSDDKNINGKSAGKWTATGAQFQDPYVFKTLFSKEPIEFDDYCETKSVQTALYLDLNEKLPDVTEYENMLAKAIKAHKDGKIDDATLKSEKDELEPRIAEGHNYKFIGKVGRFVPIKDGMGGGHLVREAGGKYASAAGAKGYRWRESELVTAMMKEFNYSVNDIVDVNHARELVDKAVDNISKYGDFTIFVSEGEYKKGMFERV